MYNQLRDHDEDSLGQGSLKSVLGRRMILLGSTFVAQRRTRETSEARICPWAEPTGDPNCCDDSNATWLDIAWETFGVEGLGTLGGESFTASRSSFGLVKEGLG